MVRPSRLPLAARRAAHSRVGHSFEGRAIVTLQEFLALYHELPDGKGVLAFILALILARALIGIAKSGGATH
jgi:hypothetical protein